MPLTLRAGSATHIGQVRQVNQDSLLIADALWAVADGMGGHAAGEVASAEALETLRRTFTGADTTALVDAVQQANASVARRGRDEPDLRGMGTTLCAIAVVTEEGSDEPVLAVVNVGDSRIYRLVAGELEQLTRDHKLVQDLVDAGELAPEDVATHPNRSVLTRALGIDQELEVDSWVIAPVKGERYLLCSDGLYDEVSDGEIATVLRTATEPDDAARELVDRANAGGGHDNITVIVADVVDDAGRLESSTAAVAQHRPPHRDTGTPPAAGTTAAPPTPPTATGHTGRDRPTSADEAPAAPTSRWRTLAFLGALVTVVAVAVGATAWYARNTYYVGLDAEAGDVVIYRGRPGGVLWFDPTLAERTDLQADEVPPLYVPDLEDGKSQSSLGDARDYVAFLRDEAERRGTTSTTVADGETDRTGGTGDETATSTTTARAAATATTRSP